MKILHIDDDIVVVEKNRGTFVHPPENKRIKIDPSQNGMAIVRDLISHWVYPVHRLDVSTSGVMIYALSSKAASNLAAQFETGTVEKIYEAIVRGHMDARGSIDAPLKRDSNNTLANALTSYECLFVAEIPVSGSRHPTTRLSWVRARPHTGRYHQIRRHFHRISHPIIGDANHGDCRINRGFAEYTGIGGLLLRATAISFFHPRTNVRVNFHAPESPLWDELESKIQWETMQPTEEVTVQLSKPQERIRPPAQNTISYPLLP